MLRQHITNLAQAELQIQYLKAADNINVKNHFMKMISPGSFLVFYN